MAQVLRLLARQAKINVVVSDSYISGADALGMIVGTGNTRLAISNTLFFNNGQSGALPGSSRAGTQECSVV